jgi:hypothetical protein
VCSAADQCGHRNVADQGIADAKRNLGAMHHQGHGAKGNYGGRTAYLESSTRVDQGHAEAQQNPGKGQGLQQDFGMAAR